jgi:hypothetical protein
MAQDLKSSLLRDTPGASWEKRGNTLWLSCGKCATWFPVSVALTRPGATPACCPNCHTLLPLN